MSIAQSSINSESSNNDGGFSGVESTMVSQLQQPKQYIGGPNNKVGNQLSGLPQHNGSLASMQSLGGHRNSGSMDPDFELKRQAIRDRIFHIHNPQQQFQSQHQFPQNQFVQHLHQQKQQNQQHQQLLLKNDALGQSQLASNLGSNQVMPEQGIEALNEALNSQISEQFQLSDLQNQFQQSTTSEDHYRGAQMLSHPSGNQNFRLSVPQNSQNLQHLLHPHHQAGESQNSFSCFSSGLQPDTLQHSQWNLQSQEKLQPLNQSSHGQHIQEEFRQRIIEQDEAVERIFHQKFLSAWLLFMIMLFLCFSRGLWN